MEAGAILLALVPLQTVEFSFMRFGHSLAFPWGVNPTLSFVSGSNAAFLFPQNGNAAAAHPTPGAGFIDLIAMLLGQPVTEVSEEAEPHDAASEPESLPTQQITQFPLAETKVTQASTFIPTPSEPAAPVQSAQPASPPEPKNRENTETTKKAAETERALPKLARPAYFKKAVSADRVARALIESILVQPTPVRPTLTQPVLVQVPTPKTAAPEIDLSSEIELSKDTDVIDEDLPLPMSETHTSISAGPMTASSFAPAPTTSADGPPVEPQKVAPIVSNTGRAQNIVRPASTNSAPVAFALELTPHEAPARESQMPIVNIPFTLAESEQPEDAPEKPLLETIEGKPARKESQAAPELRRNDTPQDNSNQDRGSAADTSPKPRQTAPASKMLRVPEAQVERFEVPTQLSVQQPNAHIGAHSDASPTPLTTPAESTPKPHQEVATALRNAEPTTDAPMTRTGEARDIAIQLGNAATPAVELQLSERAGRVHVEVRTPDSTLQTSLRQDLGTLVRTLDGAGYRAEATVPHQPSKPLTDSNLYTPETQTGFGREDRRQNPRDQQQRRQNRGKSTSKRAWEVAA